MLLARGRRTGRRRGRCDHGRGGHGGSRPASGIVRAMNDLSFFWHDYETFGRVPRRDRPAQFAGLRTDAALNEIGEPVMV